MYVDFYQETGWPVAVRRHPAPGLIRVADVHTRSLRLALSGRPVVRLGAFRLDIAPAPAVVKFCPFCGSKDIIVVATTETAGFWGRCKSCLAAGPRRDDPTDAEHGWQERHFLPATQTDFKAFEKE